MRYLIIGLGVALALAAGAGAEWEVETVDYDARGYSGICSLALDGAGHPHVAYRTFGKETRINYARWDGERWFVETVETSAEISGCDVSLALDSRDEPHIVYEYSLRGYDPYSRYGRKYKCKYARRAGGRWDIQEIAAGAGYYCSVAAGLDGEGCIHIARRQYVNEPEGSRDELTYTRWDGTAWRHEIVAIRESLDGAVYVALTGEEKPRVLCGQREFVPVGPRWEERFIPSYGAVALDAGGGLHFAFERSGGHFYADPESRELHYARPVGGEWEEETVDVKRAAGLGISLALDREGLPYISYFDNYDLRFAHFTGEEWVVHTVDASDRPIAHGPFTSVAVSDIGRPVIAYFDNEAAALKCARWDGGEWRNPPASEADRSKDLTGAGEIVSWYLEGVPYITEDRRSSTRTLESGRIYAEPADEVECLLEFDVPTDAEFIGGRSVHIDYEGFPGEVREMYRAWVEVKAGDVVGWTDARTFFSNDYPNPSFARFGQKYSPLKEGPSEDAPPAPEDAEPGDRWSVGPTASAGQYFEVVGRVGDWCCLWRGGSDVWAPAEAPGLEYYYLTYAWEPSHRAQLWFYLPGAAVVKGVFYSVHTYMGAGGVPGKDPRLEVVVDGKKVEGVLHKKGYTGGYECTTEYFEFEFPRAVKREDIESMTFSVGDEGERIHFTIDPHDAWREPATEWYWPEQGFA